MINIKNNNSKAFKLLYTYMYNNNLIENENKYDLIQGFCIHYKCIILWKIPFPKTMKTKVLDKNLFKRIFKILKKYKNND